MSRQREKPLIDHTPCVDARKIAPTHRLTEAGFRAGYEFVANAYDFWGNHCGRVSVNVIDADLIAVCSLGGLTARSWPVRICRTALTAKSTRWWFECACGARCAILYLRHDAPPICRTCADFRYPSQSQTRMARAIERTLKV